MKKSISISVESEKLSALNMYFEQKSLFLEDELNKAVDAFYQKYVPANVREYIDMITAEKLEPNLKKKSASLSQNSNSSSTAL